MIHAIRDMLRNENLCPASQPAGCQNIALKNDSFNRSTCSLDWSHLHVFRAHTYTASYGATELCHVLLAKPTACTQNPIEFHKQLQRECLKFSHPPPVCSKSTRVLHPLTRNFSPSNSLTMHSQAQKYMHRTPPQTVIKLAVCQDLHLEDRYPSLLDERVHLLGVGCVRANLTRCTITSFQCERLCTNCTQV